jgi:hypothetical protein
MKTETETDWFFSSLVLPSNSSRFAFKRHCCCFNNRPGHGGKLGLLKGFRRNAETPKRRNTKNIKTPKHRNTENTDTPKLIFENVI